VENAPRLDVRDGTLDWGAQAAHVGVKLLLPFKQFPALRFLDRRYVARALISPVANSAERCRNDLGGRRFTEGGHVVVVAGDGFGNEYDVACEIRYDLAVEAGRFMFPDHRSGVLRHDQHGARKPSTRTDWPRTAALASSAVGRKSAVAFSIRGVISVTMRAMEGCEVSKISAHTSSIMFCRVYPDDTIMASRRVSSRGRPVPLSHGFSRSAAMRSSISSSCSGSSPDIRSNRNGFSVSEGFGLVTSFLLIGEAVAR